MVDKFKEYFFTKKFLKEFFYINVGVILLAVSVIFVYDINNVSSGGASTLGIILQRMIGYGPTSLYIFLLNLVLLAIGGVFLGKEFFFKTVYGSLIFPVYGWLFEILIDATSIADDLATLYETNELLIIVVAAAIMGLGIGIVLKHGGSTGGVDNLQAIFLKYFNLPHSVSLIMIDGVIVVAGSFFLQDTFVEQLQMIMYGVVTVVISGYVIDNIVFNGFNVRSAYIITNKAEEVKQEIYRSLGRGVTEVYTKGGYSSEERMMLFCVLKTFEFNKLRSAVQRIDSAAFIVVTRAAEVHGEGFSFDLMSTSNVRKERKTKQDDEKDV